MTLDCADLRRRAANVRFGNSAARFNMPVVDFLALLDLSARLKAALEAISDGVDRNVAIVIASEALTAAREAGL